MYENKVWTLVDLPDDRQSIENKWIFKRKTDADGNVTIYKARLAAKGFRRVQGVDYDETFSPIAMLKSVWIMLAIAAFYNYGKWMSKLHSIMDFLKKNCIWCNQKFLSILKVLTKCTSSSDPSMDWCKHLGVGIYALMRWSRHMVLYRLTVSLYLQESVWELCRISDIICGWHIVDRKWYRISE